MSVCYLDVDDEITDAIARLRSARDGRVVMVVPPGSRIATSRINFRLLVREAETRGLAVAVVSGDAGARALAISAGMAAHGSVPEAEAALGLPVEGDAPGAGALWQITPAPGVASQMGAWGAASSPRGAGAVGTPGGPSPIGPSPGAPPIGAPPYGAPPYGAQPGSAGAGGYGAPPDETRLMGVPLAPGAAWPQGAAGPPGSTGFSGAAGPPGGPPGAIGQPAGPSLGTTRGRSGSAGYAVTPRATMPGGADGQRLADGTWAEMPQATRENAGVRRKGRSRTRRLVGILVRLAIVAALVGGVAYGAYLYLPTATVTLQPATQPTEPLQVTVTADPSVAVPDSTASRVPATHVPIPLSVTDTFTATGSNVTLTKAAGTVTFTSENTFFDVPIPQGTTVSTSSGIDFQTSTAVTLPKATINNPSSIDVPVKAATGGPTGNVAAGAITVAPQSISSLLVKVTNGNPTTGGKRTTTVTVTRDDYNGAIQTLSSQLQSQLAAAAQDPNNTPKGLTPYPQTASLGKLNPDKAASDIVGSTAATFDLTLQTDASWLAVDLSAVASVARDRLVATATPPERIYPQTVTTTVQPGTVQGTTITYQVIAQGQKYTPTPASEIIAKIAGKPISEARSILAAYGTVEVSIWPDFIPNIPDDARRINLTIEDPKVPQ